MVFDLALNFFVLAVERRAARADKPEGLVETAPGFRSMLVSYDPAALPRPTSSTTSGPCTTSPPAERGDDDPEPRSCTCRSRSTTRRPARPSSATRTRSAGRAQRRGRHEHRLHRPLQRASPTARSCTRRCSRASSGARSSASSPGCRSCSRSTRARRSSCPKYNPTRTWTAEGAVGIGGPCYRDLPRRVCGRLPAVRPHDPDLRHPGSQRGLPREPAAAPRRRPGPVPPGRGGRAPAAFEDVHADTYRYRIEDAPFDVGAFLDWRPASRTRRRAVGGARGRRPPRRPVR